MELWQLMSWLQSGHHVVNFSTWWRVSVAISQLTGRGSECYGSECYTTAFEEELKVLDYA